MDAVRVEVVRELLAGSEWPELTRSFAGSLRGAVRRGPAGGLLLVGSGGYEPWHMAAHLDDEAAWSGLPELSPTLVRHRVPQGAPPHLAVGTARLEAARRGETVLVVTPERAEAGLLERVDDARRSGATVLAMDMRRSRAARAGARGAHRAAGALRGRYGRAAAPGQRGGRTPGAAAGPAAPAHPARRAVGVAAARELVGSGS